LGLTLVDPDESVNAKRRKISEQALRRSENIGRLQLVVQKIQFPLLKLDDKKEIRGKTRITVRKLKSSPSRLFICFSALSLVKNWTEVNPNQNCAF
jgi:hypothetical protein